MRNRKFVLLINPIAGTRTKIALEAYLLRRLDESKFDYDIIHTTAKMTAVELRAKLQALHATDLVAVGGDGTVNIAANAVQYSDINLGIIAVGSGNGLARTANISLQPSVAMDIIFRDNVTMIDAFTVNNHFSCMLSGVGLDAAIAESFSKQSTRGLYAYTTQSFTQFIKAKTYPFTILLEGRTIETEAFFISVANSNQYGNNVTIAPKASLSDGLLDVVIITKMMKAYMPLAFVSQLTGNVPVKPVEHIGKKDDVLYCQVPGLTIINHGKAPLHIDGDHVATAERFDIKMLPAAIRLFHP